MKCPECQKEDKKSKVFIGPSSTTLIAAFPYYDEDGKYQCNNPNKTTTSYNCSNGHVWTETK